MNSVRIYRTDYGNVELPDFLPAWLFRKDGGFDMRRTKSKAAKPFMEHINLLITRIVENRA